MVFLLAGLASCSPHSAAALPEGNQGSSLVTPVPSLEPSPTLSTTHAPSPSPAVVKAAPVSTRQSHFLDCLKEGGRIETTQLNADWMHYPLDVRVYVPPCYDEHTDDAFPVLYLFHGQSYTDDQWERLGVGATADRLIAQGELSPFLIIMPRDREWIPSDKDPFGRAFLELLLPWAEQYYRVIPDRSGRAVGGLSRGAGWAVHFGLKYWQDFGIIGAHSPALFWNDGPSIVKWLDAIPFEKMPRIWIDLGAADEKEILDSANWFESQLTGRNIPHEWYLNTGEHDEKYWSSHVEQYLRWYARDW
jgi:enterochelin esterase-like enzyme